MCSVPAPPDSGVRMISIVIPAYNYAAYLPAAIDSVLAQQLDELEIIVCDDASTDDTPQIVAAYQEQYPCIRVERNPVNLGAVLNINRAVSLAQGDFVLVLGADDYLVPGALKALKQALDVHPGCAYAFGRYNIEGADGQIYPLQHPGWLANSYFGTRDEFASQLCFDCYINIGTTLFRRQVLQARPGFFDISLKTFSGERFFRATDWDLMLSLSLQNVPGAFLNQVISVFRQHQQQASGVDKYVVSGVAITEHMQLLERYLTENNLPRLLGRLPQIFQLLYSKYQFYGKHGQAPAAVDQTIRQMFQDSCQRIARLLAKDPAAVRPAALQQLLADTAASRQDADGDSPFFSVVLTTYNRPILLQNALASVLDQTCQDFEVLLVNDGGPLVENTLDWASRDPRITYIRQKNSGPAAARNAALKLARGQYIVYLDDDDLMRPEHLQVVQDQLRLTPNAVVYTRADYVQEELKGGLRIEQSRCNPFVHDDYDRRRLQICNYIPINTFCHGRAWLEQVGRFDENLRALEDWDLLIRLSRVTDFVSIRKATVEVRQRAGQQQEHQTGREYNNLHDLFKRIYQKYDDMADPAIRVGRAAILAADHPVKASLAAVDYCAWLDRHSLREVDVEVLAERMMKQWTRRPLMTLVMKVRRPWLDALGISLRSLQDQLYTDWRLIVIADYPSPDPVFTSAEILGWLQVGSLDDEMLVLQALNGIVTDCPGDWLALVPPGTEFTPDCLLRFADRVQTRPGLSAVYSDHDQVLLPGGYTEPQFKPELNLDYLLAWDYIEAACWFNQSYLLNLGGFNAFPGKEGYELLLRMIDQYGEDSVDHLSFPLMHLPQQKETPLSLAAHRVAIEQHLQRIGRSGEVREGVVPDTFKVSYPLSTQPLVSIIIPNRDKLEFLQPCLETLFAKTGYRQFEVLIVDNQSTDPDVLDFYRQVEVQYPDQVRVLAYDAPFNFSAQCNLGAASARGEYLLLLNNDIEVVQADWLERMLMHAQRREVGIVGAKLVYPETGMIQHAGILLGAGPQLLAVGSHYGADCKLDAAGYMNRLQCDMALSAVTGACMLIRQDVYAEVAGFNQELSVLFNDIEFCLRISKAGYKIVWCADAILVHHHGMSVNARLADPVEQGRFAERSRQEHLLMFDQWRTVLANDRAYNRNLSLSDLPCSLESIIPCRWEPSGTERPKILAAALSGGSGEYRIGQPLHALAIAGKAQVAVISMGQSHNRLPKPLEVERLNPDVIVVQNGFNDLHLETAKWYQTYFPDRLRVMSLDDLLSDLPEKSGLFRHIKANFRDARRRMRQAFSYMDRAIVSTEPLADAIKDLIDDIHLVPNRLEKHRWWGLKSTRQVGRKPRVGWVGAQQHKGDLEIIHEVIRQLADEVDWVFMGMWPEELADLIKVRQHWVAYHRYPAQMASLNLDLALAPLEINAFNESKSNLRLLEYGAMGWPVVCTDIFPYQTNQAPVKRVPNTVDAWLEAIRERINDLDSAYREGDTLHQWVGQHYLLEDHLEQWVAAYRR